MWSSCKVFRPHPLLSLSLLFDFFFKKKRKSDHAWVWSPFGRRVGKKKKVNNLCAWWGKFFFNFLRGRGGRLRFSPFWNVCTGIVFSVNFDAAKKKDYEKFSSFFFYYYFLFYFLFFFYFIFYFILFYFFFIFFILFFILFFIFLFYFLFYFILFYFLFYFIFFFKSEKEHGLYREWHAGKKLIFTNPIAQRYTPHTYTHDTHSTHNSLFSYA